MSGLFGGSDSFFTRLSKMFGSSMFGSASANDPSQAQRSNAPVIQELDSDSMQMLRDEDDNNGQGDKYRENSWANRNPHIEHTDDQTDVHNKNASKNSSKITSHGPDHSKVGGTRGRTSGVSFQRVTHGGINGPYYTASTTRRAGNDGVVMEESQQADLSTGQATHRISRGIHEKGQSIIRKLDSEGKVDTIQTLHNLDEDELASFEETWKGNASRLPSGWIGGLNCSGRASDLLFGQNFGRQVDRQFGNDMQSHSTRGRSKKVMTVPIE